MIRFLVLLASALLAIPALAGEPARPSAPPKADLSANDVAAALEAQGLKVSPELVKRVLPTVNGVVSKRLELEDAIVRGPQELAVALDRDPARDSAALARAVEELMRLGRLSSYTLVTDGRWKVQVGQVPQGWELASFDDRQWKVAADQGGVGVPPWSGTHGWGAPPVARWIWHYVSNSASDTDTAFFRRAFVARSAATTLYVTADNEFWAFLDGQPVGHGDDWPTVYSIPLKLTPGKTHVLAIKVVNKGGPGALVAEAK